MTTTSVPSKAKLRVRDTSAVMFARGGFDGVSMRDLAEVLGIEAPSIYSHYASKEALLEGICQPYLDALDELTCVAAATSPELWVQRWLDLMLEHLHAVRLLYGDVAVRRREPGPRAAAADFFFEAALADFERGPRMDPALARVLIAATRAPFLNISNAESNETGVDVSAIAAVLELVRRCCEQSAVPA